MSSTKQELLDLILELCEELETRGAYAFFEAHDPLDVISRVSHGGGRKTYQGAEIVIATGGPHIEVVTGQGNDTIVGYWGGDRIERSTDSDDAYAWAEELFAADLVAER